MASSSSQSDRWQTSSKRVAEDMGFDEVFEEGEYWATWQSASNERAQRPCTEKNSVVHMCSLSGRVITKDCKYRCIGAGLFIHEDVAIQFECDGGFHSVCTGFKYKYGPCQAKSLYSWGKAFMPY